MCHGVLPLLTRPSPGRTQASLDVQLLPFLADVSAITRVVVTETTPELFGPVRDARQRTDVHASCPHFSKYITSDRQSCDISTQPQGGWVVVGLGGLLSRCSSDARCLLKREVGRTCHRPVRG